MPVAPWATIGFPLRTRLDLRQAPARRRTSETRVTRILTATDFSARSDRALRRALLLCRTLPAGLTLLHVVDGDRPAEMVESERRIADALLSAICRTLREQDRIDAEPLQRSGEAFEGIVDASAQLDADLIVLGAHRRQILRDVFVGTTAERTVRYAQRPVLMANAVPAAPHRRIAVAVDGSEASASALRAVLDLGLDRGASLTLLHLFDALAIDLRLRTPAGIGETEYLAQEHARAEQEMRSFLHLRGLPDLPLALRRNDAGTGATLCAAAAELSADLLVLGTRGRGGRAALGSVAAAVLGAATVDVLVVPARATPDDQLSP